jgi:alcohol dehydrogenase class IV
LGVPASLRDIGMPQDGLDRAADLAMRDPYWNPRPLEPKAIRDMLERAFRGERPAGPG